MVEGDSDKGSNLPCLLAHSEALAAGIAKR
jgi:hypothetical protein